MKKYFFLCLLTLGCMMGFTACDDDDEDENVEVVYNANGAKITESANQLVMTMTETEDGETYTFKAVLDFQNDICVRATGSETYATASAARAAYEDYLEDLDEDEDASNYSLKGNTITVNMTSTFAGWTKERAKAFLIGYASGEYGVKAFRQLF